MKRYFVAACLLLVFGCAVYAQVVDTTVCDVVKKPAPFNGKMVRIKGTVVAGLDQFMIKDSTDPNCGYQVNAIWLAYPQGTKGKAGAAAIVTVQPAHNFTGQYTPPARTAVTLEKSKEFKQFDSLLAQTHQKGADICLGCTRYEVTATLVGRLDAVADATLKRDAAGKIIGFGGFGNMNAYPARLVLQSVSDVTPKEIDFSKTDAAIKSDAMQASGGSNDLRGAIDASQKLASTFPAGPPQEALVKAASAYGKPSEHNGVNLSTGSTNETPDEALGTKDSPDGVLFNCIFNSERLPADALARAVFLIGSQVSELRHPKAGNEDAPAYFLENNAMVVAVVTGIYSNEKYLTLPGAYQVWNVNWPADQRNDKMQAALKDYLSNETMLSR